MLIRGLRPTTSGRCASYIRSLSTKVERSRGNAVSPDVNNFIRSDGIPGLETEVHPGVRLFAIKNTSQDNISRIAAPIKQSLQSIAENTSVGAIVFKLDECDVLSSFKAYGGSSTTDAFNQAYKIVTEMPDLMKSCRKPTIVIFNGYVANSGYTFLFNAKYRIGTKDTRFQLKGLRQSMLPVGGHLIYRLTRSCEEGVAMTRFLGVTEKVIDAIDMYNLGLLTHVTHNNPHYDLIPLLSNTVSPNNMSKAVQPESIDNSSLDDFLESMHVLECSELDIDSSFYNKYSLIPPEEIGKAEVDDPNKQLDALPPLEDMEEFILEVFSKTDVDECVARLRAIVRTNPVHPHQEYAKACLDRMEKIPMRVLRLWWQLTRQSVLRAKDAFPELELRYLKELTRGSKAKETAAAAAAAAGAPAATSD